MAGTHCYEVVDRSTGRKSNHRTLRSAKRRCGANPDRIITRFGGRPLVPMQAWESDELYAPLVSRRRKGESK